MYQLSFLEKEREERVSGKKREARKGGMAE